MRMKPSLLRKSCRRLPKSAIPLPCSELWEWVKVFLPAVLVQSLTAAEEVPSPTFTLVQSYEAPDFEIYHFDLYRLKAPEEIFELGMEEALYGGVCLIEWPEKMAGWLPENCFKLTITPDAFGRRITISSASAEKLSRLRKLELR